MAVFQHKYYTIFTFSKTIDGKVKHIDFNEGNLEPFRGAFLFTNDDKVIAAVRGLKMFKEGAIEEMPDIENEADTTEEWVALFSYAGVTKAQDAKEILVASHGADPVALKNAKDTRDFAYNNKVDFPDWKR